MTRRFLDIFLAMTILLPLIGAVVLFWFLSRPAHSRTLYPGQYAQYTPEERAWFKGVRSPKGVPCCDIGDGHLSTWQKGEGGYVVRIVHEDDGETYWHFVPPEAVVENARNPTNETWVWYVLQGDNSYFIRCFVPGDGV